MTHAGLSSQDAHIRAAKVGAWMDYEQDGLPVAPRVALAFAPSVRGILSSLTIAPEKYAPGNENVEADNRFLAWARNDLLPLVLRSAGLDYTRGAWLARGDDSKDRIAIDALRLAIQIAADDIGHVGAPVDPNGNDVHWALGELLLLAAVFPMAVAQWRGAAWLIDRGLLIPRDSAYGWFDDDGVLQRKHSRHASDKDKRAGDRLVAEMQAKWGEGCIPAPQPTTRKRSEVAKRAEKIGRHLDHFPESTPGKILNQWGRGTPAELDFRECLGYEKNAEAPAYSTLHRAWPKTPYTK